MSASVFCFALIRKITIVVFLIQIVLLFSCKKEAGPDPDIIAPVVTITSPTNNQIFDGASTVNVEAMITDNSKLEEIHLEILNKATNTLYTHEHFMPTGSSYHLTSSFQLPSQAEFEITIEGVDETGNHEEASVTISAN